MLDTLSNLQIADKTEIHRYVRDNKHSPIGVIMARKMHDGTIVISWSLCNKLDKFDKQKALFIAARRAEFGMSKNVLIPHKVERMINDMIYRAQKYFRTDDVVIV